MIYRLENKQYFWALLLIPLMIGIWWAAHWLMNRRTAKLSSKHLLGYLMPYFSVYYTYIRNGILLVAILMIILALINPQTGRESVTSRSVGFQINFIVDVSNSMLAEDVRPNRLEVVRSTLYKLINSLKENRIGITVFAGEAFNQIPPTSDENILEAVLSTLSPDLVPTQGSDLSKAFQASLQNFNFEEQDKKFIILFSDGEHHEQDYLSLVKEAVEKGITIHVIGVGSTKGSSIPIKLPIGKTGLLKDMQGNVVVTRLNEPELQFLAQEGRGVYSKIVDGAGVRAIASSINSNSKRVVNEKIYSEYFSYFPYFIYAALFFLLIEFFMPQYKLAKKN